LEFRSQEALRRKILNNSGSLSTDFRPNRFWHFYAKFQHTSISDKNTQNLATAKAEYQLIKKQPWVSLYYDFFGFKMSEPDMWNGYFNPRFIHTHSLGVSAGFNVTKRLYLDFKTSGGYEFLKPGGSPASTVAHPSYFIGGGASYNLTDSLAFSMRGEFFDARPDQNNENGYSKKTFYFLLTYNFGTAPGQFREPSASSRPVTGR